MFQRSTVRTAYNCAVRFSARRAVTLTAVAVVLLLAAYVRLSHPELAWFGVDQARDTQAALDIVAGRSFPLLGVELTGGPGHTWGPAYFYLIAIPFAVSRDPVVAVAFLGALGVASLVLTYRFAVLFFGRAVALLSLALISTYPLAVIESKALWNVAPVPLFAVVFFHALFSLTVHRRSVAIIPALAVLGVLLQFHLSAISLVVVLVLALVLFRPPLRALHLGLGLGLTLALLLPYLLAQWLTGFEDLRAATSPATARLHLRGSIEVVELAVRVLFASPDLVGGMPALQKTWRPDVVLGLHRLEAWSLVAGLAFVGLAAVSPFLRRRRPDGHHRSVVLVALGFAVPLVALTARAYILPYYFDVTYPLPFIASALALGRAVEWAGAIAGPGVRRAAWSAVAVVAAATMVSQVDFHRRLWREIQTTGTIVWTPGALELMPIRYTAELTRIFVENFGVDPTRIAERLHGSWSRDLLEAKGHFVERTIAVTSREYHYVIIRDEVGAAPVQGRRIARAGPYTVVEYLPLIEYSTWKCNDHPRDPSEWAPVEIPTTGSPVGSMSGLLPARRWRSPTVACQGAMSAGGPRPLRIVVSLHALGPGDRRVDSFHLNGVPVTADRIRLHSTFAAHNTDMVFNVGDHLRPGPNALAFRIFSDPPQFDLDVHEIDR